MNLTASSNPERLSNAWETIHQDFHLSLISGCNSRWLIHFHNQLAEQSARYRRLAISFTDAKRDIADEHANIVKAVLARDADRACQLIGSHFARTTDIVLRGSGSKPVAKVKH